MKQKKTNKENIQLVSRPPVVAILGHIDHGKTALLDYIRKTNVVAKEAGGITQHIGAYEISHTTSEGQTSKITFIDTPGHEAFSKIRSRGAKAADIAILVVAADEGVKPQTVEALEHIKQSGAILVVAINKIDKPEANPQKVKQQLAEKEVLLEGWGGSISNQEISAKTGKGIPELLDLILLAAELEELKANPNAEAEGVVIEANKDAKKGNIATLLIKNGTLRQGEYIFAGESFGKIKSMANSIGDKILEATFSAPVSITGFEELPAVGDTFKSTADKKMALALKKVKIAAISSAETKDFQTEETEKPTLNIILKADVYGSKEALEKMINDFKFEKVQLRMLKCGLGDINENDVIIAKSSNAVIAAFKVKIPIEIAKFIQASNVEVIRTDIIYELIGEIRARLENLLPPEIIKTEIGKLSVLAAFKSDKSKMIAGGKVSEGKIKKGVMADIKRNSNMVLTGKISQLQHNKADVDEVQSGRECGFMITPTIFHLPDGKIASGDKMEIYQEEKKPQKLA